MRLTIVNLFLGAWWGRFGRHPCTKAPAIEPAICGASVAADARNMGRITKGGKRGPGSRLCVATYRTMLGIAGTCRALSGTRDWNACKHSRAPDAAQHFFSDALLSRGPCGRLPRSHRHLAMQDGRTRGEAFRRIDDRVRVDAVVAIEISDRAGLAELLDAERLDAM